MYVIVRYDDDYNRNCTVCGIAMTKKDVIKYRDTFDDPDYDYHVAGPFTPNDFSQEFDLNAHLFSQKKRNFTIYLFDFE